VLLPVKYASISALSRHLVALWSNAIQEADYLVALSANGDSTFAKVPLIRRLSSQSRHAPPSGTLSDSHLKFKRFFYSM